MVLWHLSTHYSSLKHCDTMALSSTPKRGEIALESLEVSSISRTTDNDEKLDMLLELAKENAERIQMLMNEKHGKTQTGKVDVSRRCSAVIRRTYVALPASSKWIFDDSFQAPENLTVTSAVVDEVLKEYGDRFDRDEIRAGCKVFWRSLRDRQRRIDKGTNDKHVTRVKRNYRINYKLENRKCGLKAIEWPSHKKEKVANVLTKEYMSSEDEEDGKRLVLPLRWESAKLRKYKEALDQAHLKTCKRRQLVLMCERSRSDERFSTQRNPPHNAPEWCTTTE